MLEKSPDVAQVLADERRRSARRRRLRRGALAAFAVAAAGLGWLWYSGAFREAGVTYITDPAVVADIAVTVVASGSLEPTGQVAITSALAGTVESVDVGINDPVSEGQVLARLDMRDLDARVKKASAMVAAQAASLLAAQATLDDATAALERATALRATDGVAQRDVELAASAVKRAQANLAGIEAQLAGAQADLQSARNDYDRATIRSPIDGMVYELNVDPGQSLAASALGQPMLRIAEDLRQLTLLVDIDEADIGQVTQGDGATFSVEAWPNRDFTGTIRQIRSAPAVVDGVVSYRAELDVDNEDFSLRPGMTATADIAVDTVTGVLTVANAALRFSPKAVSPARTLVPGSTAEPAAPDASRSVWVLREGRPVEVEVTAGLSDGQRTVITGGDLSAGDIVIIGERT